MQIVIDIPEEIYNMSRIAIVHPLAETNIPLAVICNGTPLPERYGDLIDKDVIQELLSKKCAGECGVCMYNEDGCILPTEAPTILEGTK